MCFYIVSVLLNSFSQYHNIIYTLTLNRTMEIENASFSDVKGREKGVLDNVKGGEGGIRQYQRRGGCSKMT